MINKSIGQVKNAKKIVGRNVFTFLNVYWEKAQLIKALNSPDSSRSYERLLENQKPGASTELFLPENDIKTSSKVNFSKKILEIWKQTKDMNLRLDSFFIYSYTFELNITYIKTGLDT